ncbi:MAG: hypothetical protein QXE57_05000 [Nitrososphaerales archaeon]
MFGSVGGRFEEFLDVLRSVETRVSYRERLGFLARSLGFGGVDGVIDLAARDGGRLTVLLLDWVKRERGRVSGNRIRAILSGLRMVLSFYELDRNVGWEKVRMAVPPARKASNDRAPTREELKDLLDVADLRFKFAITAMCSGGFRVGAWDYLTLQDISYVECGGVKFGRLVVYRGEPEEYVTFLTPEAMKFYEKYLEQRRIVEEQLKPQSPLLRDVWQWQNKRQKLDPAVAKPLGSKRIRNAILELWWKTPHRRRGVKPEFKMVHGFRKFFETNAALGISREMDIEVLKGRRYNYYKPSEKHLMEEYVKAIPYLTITEQPTQHPQEDKEKEQLKKQLAKLQAQVAALTKDAEEFRGIMRALKQSANGKVEITLT